MCAEEGPVPYCFMHVIGHLPWAGHHARQGAHGGQHTGTPVLTAVRLEEGDSAVVEASGVGFRRGGDPAQLGQSPCRPLKVLPLVTCLFLFPFTLEEEGDDEALEQNQATVETIPFTKRRLSDQQI